MTQSNRTLSGGLIDRHEPINFTFNGKQLTGYAGIPSHQPCWQMASISSGEASNTVVFAAFLAVVQKSRMPSYKLAVQPVRPFQT